MTTTTSEAGAVPTFQLHHRLSLAMEHGGRSREDMAELFEVEPSTISRWTNGKTRPRKATLWAWAAICDVDAEWLETGQAPTGKPGPGRRSLYAIADSNREPADLQPRHLAAVA